MDTKEIKEQLKNSLDMVSIRMYLFIAGIIALIVGGVMALSFPDLTFGPSRWLVFAVGAAASAMPLLLFCMVRTISLFRCPGSYHFCKTTLCNPKGGRIRDTIRFLVVLEDADGCKFTAYTHSIFHTHRSSAGLALEDYVNREVTVGYNEETGQVVVIG